MKETIILEGEEIREYKAMQYAFNMELKRRVNEVKEDLKLEKQTHMMVIGLFLGVIIVFGFFVLSGAI